MPCPLLTPPPRRQLGRPFQPDAYPYDGRAPRLGSFEVGYTLTLQGAGEGAGGGSGIGA